MGPQRQSTENQSILGDTAAGTWETEDAVVRIGMRRTLFWDVFLSKFNDSSICRAPISACFYVALFVCSNLFWDVGFLSKSNDSISLRSPILSLDDRRVPLRSSPPARGRALYRSQRCIAHDTSLSLSVPSCSLLEILLQYPGIVSCSPPHPYSDHRVVVLHVPAAVSSLPLCLAILTLFSIMDQDEDLDTLMACTLEEDVADSIAKIMCFSSPFPRPASSTTSHVDSPTIKSSIAGSSRSSHPRSLRETPRNRPF
ncbi:hypothetical protein A0H81_02015 [Grifola frondosa]|uniref:Uncharacterized protein n=1 Tax=Grifola frondosa TaxID=5627 RepID=A0A1C7MLP6_GRIFR|nr:hypothetical protein A0H81_02015 [Grifola frondosa]